MPEHPAKFRVSMIFDLWRCSHRQKKVLCILPIVHWCIKYSSHRSYFLTANRGEIFCIYEKFQIAWNQFFGDFFFFVTIYLTGYFLTEIKSDDNVRITRAGSSSSLSKASFLIKATLCAKRQVDIDSWKREREWCARVLWIFQTNTLSFMHKKKRKLRLRDVPQCSSSQQTQ